MSGFDDQVAVVGDWLPSPTSIFSSIVNNDATIFRSNIENVHEPVLLGSEGHNALENAAQNSIVEDSLGAYEASNWNSLAEPKMGSGKCLKERIAARAGFNAPRLNTESIRPADLSRNLDVRSQYFTIPPGLSPTTLLDSPVFLTNSLVLPSPTTGKFTVAVNNLNSTFMADASDKGKENAIDDAWSFMPKVESRLIPQYTGTNNVHSSGFAPEFLPYLTSSVHSDTSLMNQSVEPTNSQTFRTETENGGSNLSMEQTNIGVRDNSSPLDESGEDDGDRKSSEDPHVGSGRTVDGYNWRKYGQKQVKGSEYPRSYYKCTYVNCPVKKKVERSLEGLVTEIIYKGAHNHPKPAARKSSIGSFNALSDMQLEPEGGTSKNGDLIWSAAQNGSISGAPGWGQGNVDVRSSASLVQEYNGANLQVQNCPQPESGDGVEASSTLSNAEDDDDRVTHGSVSLGDDGEGDESESKRRRIETYTLELSGVARAMREPRIVVQTTSDVDILDDGYRWRKYGQKVVKGNPNPRSYYKCTTPGCNVRKHVERASHDLKSVITTYEGKHNHNVPATRNSSHISSGNLSALPSQIAQPAASAPPPSHIPRLDPFIGASSFQRPSLGSLGLLGRPQLVPGLGFRLGMNQPGNLANLVLGEMGNHSRIPVHSNFRQLGYMVPKEEPNSDSNINSSNGSAVYQKLMSQMPRGPQM